MALSRLVAGALNSVITHIFVQITFIISNNSLFSQLTRKNYTPI